MLIREGRGVLRHAGFERTYHQRLLTAAWTAGDGAVISHLAAASLWSFDGIQPGAVEVSVPLAAKPAAGGRAGSTGFVTSIAVDVTTRGLIPVTTPARTLLDMRRTVQRPQIEEALDGACRRDQIDLRSSGGGCELLRHRAARCRGSRPRCCEQPERRQR